MAESLRANYQQRVAVENPQVGNKVPALQRLFQARDGLPVHLKGRHDARIYRGVMAVSVVGLSIAFFSIYRMATGQIQKK